MAIYHADSWNPISVITADAWPWDQTNHFQHRNKWCGARDHGLLWRSMNFIRKQVKLENNKQLFHVQQYICCTWRISTVAGHLSLGHRRQDGIRVGDNRCTGERTIPLHCVPPLARANHISCFETSSLIHNGCIVYSVSWSSFFSFLEAAIRGNRTFPNI